jgi:hypothetical protein
VASSLEHVSEEDGHIENSNFNKEASSYNIATSDITAIPSKVTSPKLLSPKHKSLTKPKKALSPT